MNTIELTVYTVNGHTYKFTNVSNLRPETNGFAFDYVGVSTGKVSRAKFNNSSVAGYSYSQPSIKVEHKMTKYVLSDYGVVHEVHNRRATNLTRHEESGNLFEELEDAISERNYRISKRSINKWKINNDSESLNWYDDSETKYSIYRCPISDEVEVSRSVVVRLPGVIYFSSSEMAYKCIEELGDEVISGYIDHEG